MTENQVTKWIGASKTAWGVIISVASTIVPVLAPLIGADVTATDVVAAGDSLWAVVQAVGFAFGTILTIWGRLKAKGPATIMPS